MKPRTRPVKRGKYIVVIVPDPIIPLEFDDYEYLTADSFPSLRRYDDDEPRVWTRELLVDMFGCTGDDTDDETVYLNDSDDDDSGIPIVERANNIADDDVDAIAYLAEQLRRLSY